MKTLIKQVTIGEYEFYVGLDRDIVASSFEQFPDLIEYLMKYKSSSNEDFIVKAAREKTLHLAISMNEKIAEFVGFAFPLMLKKADEEKETDNADKADEMLKYISDNEVDEEFNAAMFEFICSGFTSETAERKPKVKFTMK